MKKLSTHGILQARKDSVFYIEAELDDSKELLEYTVR
jgi:hypothetical protein